VDISVLGLEVRSQSVEKATQSLSTFEGAAKRAEMTVNEFGRSTNTATATAAAHGTAVGASTGKLQANTAALRAQNAALVANAASSKMAAFQQRNLVFQLNDVFVSLASGMNPMMVAVQQGSQIATIYGPGEGGIGRAFKETGKLITGVLTKFPLVTAAVVGIGGAMFGLRKEINAGAGETVSYGDVALAAFQVARDGVMSILQPAINAIAPWFTVAYHAVRDATVTVINGTINSFRAGFAIVRETWSDLPEVMGDIVLSTANMVITGIESMVNGAIAGINRLGTLLNEFTGANLGTIDSVGLGRVDNPFAGAMSGVAGDISAIASREFSRNPLGGLFNDIQQKAIENARDGLEEVADATSRVGSGASAAANDMQTAVTATNRLADAQQGLMNAGKGAFGSLISGLREGKTAMDSLQGALDRLADSLWQMAIDSIFSGGGAGGGLGSLVASFFGGGQPMNLLAGIPARANGGPVQAGGTYLVGERGPELFTAQSNGYVTSNADMRNSDGLNITVGVSADSQGNLTPFVEQVSGRVAGQVVKVAAPRIVDQSVSKTGQSIAQGDQDKVMGRFGVSPRAVVR
jgi:hypothetical protein